MSVREVVATMLIVSLLFAGYAIKSKSENLRSDVESEIEKRRFAPVPTVIVERIEVSPRGPAAPTSAPSGAVSIDDLITPQPTVQAKTRGVPRPTPAAVENPETGRVEESEAFATGIVSNRSAIGLGGGEYAPKLDGSCDVMSLRDTMGFDMKSGRWRHIKGKADKWCDGFSFPVSTETLLQKFKGKRILFLGDSVVRNTFVLTAARICNRARMDKCITRMPTPPFGEDHPERRGPFGCIPK